MRSPFVHNKSAELATYQPIFEQIDKIVYSHCHAVLLSAGQVFTVGSNEELQLGRETQDDISTVSSVPLSYHVTSAFFILHT